MGETSAGTLAETKQLLALVTSIGKSRTTAAGAYASWSTQTGSIHLTADGLGSLTDAAEILRRRNAYRTYPLSHLMRIIAHSLINHPQDASETLKQVELQ